MILRTGEVNFVYKPFKLRFDQYLHIVKKDFDIIQLTGLEAGYNFQYNGWWEIFHVFLRVGRDTIFSDFPHIAFFSGSAEDA